VVVYEIADTIAIVTDGAKIKKLIPYCCGVAVLKFLGWERMGGRGRAAREVGAGGGRGEGERKEIKGGKVKEQWERLWGPACSKGSGTGVRGKKKGRKEKKVKSLDAWSLM